MKNKVYITAHSLSPQGDELITVLATFPRIILAEINTHRMLSKNTSSSRAIPFKKMVESVQNNPFIPIAWQKEHTGMQGCEYFQEGEYEAKERAWLRARDKAIEEAQQLDSLKVTKQLCNRLLEPFMWTTMLITGSREGWNNFFKLRCPQYALDVRNKSRQFFKSKKDFANYVGKESDITKNGGTEEKAKEIFFKYNLKTDLDWLKCNLGQAEIHIMDLAEKIYDAVNESNPKQLKAGEWHIPFYNKINIDSVGTNINDEAYGLTLRMFLEAMPNLKSIKGVPVDVKISTAMAARTSYTVVGDEKEVDYFKMIELHDRLLSQDPPHCFTEGTEILTSNGWLDFKELNNDSKIASVNISNLRFNGFEKPNNIIKEDYNGVVYELPQGGITISPNHILLGNIISKSSDRTKSYNDVVKINPVSKELNTRNINIFREMRMFSACNPQYGEDKTSELYLIGVLYGFFIGDGSCKHKNVYFHLKKKRKINFLENLLLSLGKTYSITEYKDGTVNFIINEDTDVFTKFYDLQNNKIIPDFLPCDNLLFLNGLFDGLKNSDGSIKRNTWVYDTTSKPLHDRILELCPLIGLTGISYDTYDHFRIGFTTDNNILVNDSRKPNSKVIKKEYTGKLYCVDIPSKGIIVRKNGKVLITHNSSPLEHCARAMDNKEYSSFIKGNLDSEIDEDGYIDISTHINNHNSFGWCNNLKGFIPYRYFIDNKIEI